MSSSLGQSGNFTSSYAHIGPTVAGTCVLYFGTAFTPIQWNPSNQNFELGGGGTFTVNPAGNADHWGLKVANNQNSGTVTNAYGIKIEAVAKFAGTITNAYGLHVTMPTAGASNYAGWFGGEVAFGTDIGYAFTVVNAEYGLAAYCDYTGQAYFGVVQAGNYVSGNGNPGLTTTRQLYNPLSGFTETLTFENGLLIAVDDGSGV